MPLIKNPNTEGRLAHGVGEVAPGATVEVPEAVAAELADGANFIRVDGPAPRVDEPPVLPDGEDSTPKKPRK